MHIRLSFKMALSSKTIKFTVAALLAITVIYVLMVGNIEETLQNSYDKIGIASYVVPERQAALTLFSPDFEAFFSTLKKDIVWELLNSESSDAKNPLGQLQDGIESKLASLNQDQIPDAVSHKQVEYMLINDLLKEAIGSFDSQYFEQEKDRKSYYKYIIEDIVVRNRPNVSGFSKSELGKNLGGRYYAGTDNPRYTIEELTHRRLRVPEEKLKDLKKTHHQIVDTLRQLPLPPRKFFKGKGIVIMSSQEYLPGALVTIGQLREVGSQLPVEVVLDFETEYDVEMCDEMLPKLNAKCVVIERELTKNIMDQLDLGGFQLKALGLLVSTFDHTILLDADNVVVKNVDQIFDSTVYKESKFIMWPDLWHRGTSPAYYDIAQLEIGELVGREGLKNDGNYFAYLKLDRIKEQAFSDFAGAHPGQLVESGQMVFSKNEHYRALILALYYNVYGESHYYPLLYQGSFGVGDRETFLPALSVMKEPYYFSDFAVWLAGFYFDKEMTNFQETTIVQYDPDQAYFYLKNWRKWLKEKGHDSRLTMVQANSATAELHEQFTNDMRDVLVEPDIMFLHMHRPKINPIVNADIKHTRNYGAYARRNMGQPAFYPELGQFDWELHIHAVSKWVACEFINKKYWDKLELNQKDICKAVTKFVRFLQKDTKYPDSVNLQVLPQILKHGLQQTLPPPKQEPEMKNLDSKQNDPINDQDQDSEQKQEKEKEQQKEQEKEQEKEQKQQADLKEEQNQEEYKQKENHKAQLPGKEQGQPGNNQQPNEEYQDTSDEPNE